MNPRPSPLSVPLSGGASPLARLRLVGVCTWRGGARAAYSIVHDDVGQPEADGALDFGLPELSQRRLRAGFATVIGDIEARGMWPRLATLVGDGHEILNHSWDHCNLVERPDYEAQIDRPQALAQRRLGAHAPRLFAFPYDAYDEPAREHLRSRAFAGARAGERGVDVADAPADDFYLRYDTYGPDYSVYEEDVLNAHVDAAIESGGWAVRELHGVEDQSWEMISRVDYARHLDRLVEAGKTGRLWTDTPSVVAAYRRRRAEAGPCSLVEGELRFDSARPSTVPSGDLSVEVEVDPAFALTAVQGGHEIECRPLPQGVWRLELDPYAGPTHLGTRSIGSRNYFSSRETSLS